MKKSIVSELYSGKLGSRENIRLGRQEEISARQCIHAGDTLSEELSEKQKILLEEYTERSMLSGADSQSQHFCAGFKLGLLLGVEAAELDEWEK